MRSAGAVLTRHWTTGRRVLIVMPRLRLRPRCRCGHDKATHKHFRPGKDCGACGPAVCAAYRPRRLSIGVSDGRSAQGGSRGRLRRLSKSRLGHAAIAGLHLRD